MKQFQWVPRGKAIKYLGFQVGIDLALELQVLPLLLLIRKKLLSYPWQEE